MKISVLGCGRWGSFIAWYLNRIGHNVTLWGLETDPYVQNFFSSRKNDYLTLPAKIKTTTNLDVALKNEIVIISISSQALRSFLQSIKQVKNYDKRCYVLCMKGIEESTGKRLSEILIESGIDKNNIAVWVGPGHIQDYLMEIPGVMLIDSYNDQLSNRLIDLLKSDLIKFYKGQDIIGSEIGAATKNVMGIAAGMLDGLGYHSLKGALMARGAFEVSKLIKASGGKAMSAYGLAHLGDYEATLFSEHSNNRKFGENLVKNIPFDKLAEGVKTSTAILMLAKKYNIEMPITKIVNDVAVKHKDPKQSLKILFERTNMKEFV